MKSKFVKLLRYLVARRYELSSLQGVIISAAAAFGYAVNPEHLTVYIQGAIFVAGLLGVVCPDTFGGAQRADPDASQ